MAPRFGRALDNVMIAAGLIGVVVMVAALAGILSRPLGHAAVFWPANPLLLGLMLRDPRLARPGCWPAAFIGYVAADLMTGGTWGPTLWASAANLAGCLTGYALFARVHARDRELRQLGSFMQMLVAGAAAAGVAAAIAVFVAPPLFGLHGLDGWFRWFCGELLNYQTLLPVVLTFPALGRWRRRRQQPRTTQADWRLGLPALALAVALAAGTLVGGPGVLGFAVPALLWCGLTYRQFTTALLTLGFAMWTILTLAAGWIGMSIGGDLVHNLTSAFLGIALVSLMPVTVASVTRTRNDLMRRLERAATRDFLTDALNRSAFTIAGKRLLAHEPVTALILDLDRFKQVNDTHGHAAGDKVLQGFARVVERNLRDDDVFGRIGGEEFAVLLRCGPDDAAAVADRIRTAFAAERVTTDDGSVVQATVSIGLAAGPDDLDTLLARADGALYRAKDEGRDRVVRAG